MGIHSRTRDDISKDILVDIYLIYPKNNHIKSPHRAKTKLSGGVVFLWPREIYCITTLKKKKKGQAVNITFFKMLSFTPK